MKALQFIGLLALVGAAQAEEKHLYLLIGQSNMAGRAPIAEADAEVIEITIHFLR